MPGGPLLPTDPRTLGDFRVVARLGEGGQGVVYEALASDGERVAVKVLKNGADPTTRARLAREVEAARRVAPFCTARVITADLDRPDPFVVSEFVAGPSLAERVRENGPLRGGDLDRLAVGTASALAAIHGAGVVHRDFKPANVLLGPDGPRVVDFGIARPPDAGTATSALSGTPPYMAPEQLNGVRASPASDVFAWAGTMVYAATGRSPFGGDTVAIVFGRILTQEPDLAGVPAGLLPTLAACLAKDPAARPTARDLMIRLVDPGASTVAVPGVGPVPSAYVPGTRPVPAGPPGPSTAPLPAGPPAPFGSPLPAGSPGPSTAPLPDTPGGRPTAGPSTTPRAPGPPHGRRAPGGRRRVRNAALAAALAVIAVLGVTGVPFVRGTFGGGAGAGAANHGTAPATSAGQAGPSTAPDPGATGGASGRGGASGDPGTGGARRIPEAFAGTWTGEVTSQDARRDTYSATLTLTPGSGTATWRANGCDQRATLNRVRGGDTLDLTLEQEDQCVGGDMTLVLTGSGALRFTGQDGGSSIEYRGELRRS
ncbi:hypothetical protein GCM10010517_67340 [Streptosporangium fragile]|uniref:Protein kinase domain-containing protein n=1 Tax=Streptosporangium fragile TaxID=46186 RepID=A0ABP6IPS1_9ACTN